MRTRSQGHLEEVTHAHCPGTHRIAAVIIGSLLVGVSPASAGGPSITVTPSSGLIDGQTVTVSGAGFTVPAPADLIYRPVRERHGSGSRRLQHPNGYPSVPLDFVETLTVTRFITTANQGAVDCALPGACMVGAEEDFLLQEATTPIVQLYPAELPIPNARLVHRVSPGEPVELRVQAVNDGQAPAIWSISQSNDVGLTVLSEGGIFWAVIQSSRSRDGVVRTLSPSAAR